MTAFPFKPDFTVFYPSKKISYIENINIFAPDKHNKDTQRKILR